MLRDFLEKIKIPETIRIPFFGGIWYRLGVRIDNYLILKEALPKNPLNQSPRKEKITVSLTSYPARISFVHLAIKSLMLQTVKPDRIILWLAEEQFPDKVLPEALTNLTHFGLEILWMHDIYGHKKYFYPVKNQAENEVIITYDDDIIYSTHSIERLMKTHHKFPNCLVCERGQTYNSQCQLNPGRWNTLSDLGVTEPTFSINPSPGGGCLIPYGAFHEDAVNEDKIRTLAYKNDDLWYMFMCAQNGTKSIKTRKYHRPFSVIANSQEEQMAIENIVYNQNETVISNLIQAYPKAWEKIKPKNSQ